MTTTTTTTFRYYQRNQRHPPPQHHQQHQHQQQQQPPNHPHRHQLHQLHRSPRKSYKLTCGTWKSNVGNVRIIEDWNPFCKAWPMPVNALHDSYNAPKRMISTVSRRPLRSIRTTITTIRRRLLPPIYRVRSNKSWMSCAIRYYYKPFVGVDVKFMPSLRKKKPYHNVVPPSWCVSFRSFVRSLFVDT